MNELKFAFVIDGEVFHYLTVPDDPGFQGAIAGLRSGPQVIELPENTDFFPLGTRYENGKFILPEILELIDEDDYEVED